MRVVIAPKQFLHMMDLCANHRTAGEKFIKSGGKIASIEDKEYLKASQAMIEYQEIIGWPYKATQAQLNDYGTWAEATP